MGCKTDFRGQIRDACVFGSQRESRFEAASNAEVKLASPADLLVLTMDSGHLAFIYARDSQEQGQVDFKVSTKHLDSRGVKPSNLGRIVAVDPQYA